MINSGYKDQIRNWALQLGFSDCGFAKAARLDEDAKRLENWLKKGRYGSMHYMERHFEKRVDPTKLVDGARSVITLLFNYTPQVKQPAHLPQVSAYAYGKDYHLVIREKTRQLLELIREEIGEIQGRGFVDSAPVLERSWAVKSGLGWVGKNGNLITRNKGSMLFIATLITDLELIPDEPFLSDYCGTCNRCVEACPTEAILPEKEIDGSRCISYYTIELKESVINSKETWQDWMFGCDICQNVCPWNRFSSPHMEQQFNPIPELLSYDMQDWFEMTEDTFQKVFGNSAMARAGISGLQRNLRFLQGKTSTPNQFRT